MLSWTLCRLYPAFYLQSCGNYGCSRANNVQAETNRTVHGNVDHCRKKSTAIINHARGGWNKNFILEGIDRLNVVGKVWKRDCYLTTFNRSPHPDKQLQIWPPGMLSPGRARAVYFKIRRYYPTLPFSLPISGFVLQYCTWPSYCRGYDRNLWTSCRWIPVSVINTKISPHIARNYLTFVSIFHGILRAENKYIKRSLFL